MSSQNKNTPVEVKMLQRRSESDDLNFMLLNTFYLLKFEDKFENVLGGDESLNEDEATKFEKDFINKCFYCGCITEQSGTVITHFIIRRASLNGFFKFIKRFTE